MAIDLGVESMIAFWNFAIWCGLYIVNEQVVEPCKLVSEVVPEPMNGSSIGGAIAQQLEPRLQGAGGFERAGELVLALDAPEPGVNGRGRPDWT